MTGSYKCSCGATCTTEWCHKCGIRNTHKYNASRRNDTSSWSSSDFTNYAAMSSYSSSSDSSSSDCSSSSSDSGSCGGGD
jgi:hypothetical protein